MYYDAQLRAHDITGTPVLTTTVNANKNNFVIGREVGNNGPFHPGKFDMASFTTFAGRLSQDDVNAAYIFFWSGRKFYLLFYMTREVSGERLIGYLPCTWENQKFRFENQMTRAVPLGLLGKVQKIIYGP